MRKILQIDEGASGRECLTLDADLTAVPAFTWRGSLSPLHVLPQAILFGVAVFGPANAGSLAWLTEAAQKVSGWVPWMATHALSTPYPRFATALSLIVLLSLIWSTLVWFGQSIFNYPVLRERQRTTRALTLGLIVFLICAGLPVILASIFFSLGVAGDPSWAPGFTSRSPLGFALISAPLIYGGGMVLGGLPAVVSLTIGSYWE